MDVLIIGAGLIYFSAFTLFNVVVKKKRGKEALPHRAPLDCFVVDIRYRFVCLLEEEECRAPFGRLAT
eukprot:COSAG01_NODE_49751_length_369_cov_0.951852_1_plen_67_part_01